MTQAMQKKFQEIINKIPEKCWDKHNLKANRPALERSEGTAQLATERAFLKEGEKSCGMMKNSGGLMRCG